MFGSPRKLGHLTELFQSLCDAAMDLDPLPIVGNIPEDLLECAHLIAMADASVVRECANAARMLCDAEPHDLVNLVVAHHTKITHYLFIRSLILDGEVADVP